MIYIEYQIIAIISCFQLSFIFNNTFADFYIIKNIC